MVYPGIHAVWSRWAPPAERTRLGSFAFSGSFVGTVIGYPMCGWLVENYGWPSTFYVPGKRKHAKNMYLRSVFAIQNAHLIGICSKYKIKAKSTQFRYEFKNIRSTASTNKRYR